MISGGLGTVCFGEGNNGGKGGDGEKRAVLWERHNRESDWRQSSALCFYEIKFCYIFQSSRYIC